MTPTSYDVRGGIRRPPMFLNDRFGDCVVAWYCNNLLTKNVSNLSTWRRILYRIGFRPPTNATALADYSAYLKTLNETPGPNTGCVPSGFLTWLKAQGKIKDWGTVDYTNQELVQQAMIDHKGVGLTMSLTPYAENAGEFQMALWDVGPTNQPDPNAQHMVELVNYNVTNYAIFTWAMTIRLTRNFYGACVNGCYWFE